MPMKSKYGDVLTKEFYEEYYVQKKMSFPKISEMLKKKGKNISMSAVHNYAKKLGIGRNASEARLVNKEGGLDYNSSFLSEKMIENIDAAMLGNGSIRRYSGSSAKLQYRDNEEFCEYIKKLFEIYNFQLSSDKNVGATDTHPDFCLQYDRWYKDTDGKKQKQPPCDIRITPLTLLVWYLAHGTLVKSGRSFVVRLTSGYFTGENNEILVERIKNVGIDCYQNKEGRINISAKGISSFFNYIGSESPIESHKHKFDIPDWRIKTKRTRQVSEDNKIPYEMLNYFIGQGWVECSRREKTSRPRFTQEQEEAAVKFYYYYMNTTKEERTVQTNMKRFGVENPFQSEEIKKKIRETNIKKYGTESPIKLQETLEKSKETMLERYGVENPAYGELKEKAVATFKETVKNDTTGRYVIVNTLRYNEEFWSFLEQGGTLTDACNKFGLDYGNTSSRISHPEFYDRFKSVYSYPKHQKQRQIYDIIKSWGLNPEFDTQKIIPPMELDIYVPDKKFAIEFNGSHWHSESVLDSINARNKHINKTKACREKGIQLFHIFEKTWEERESQILNFIKATLGKNENVIGARQCKISHDKCDDFIEENHIQGKSIGIIRYFNLVYDGGIIATMTASPHHRQNVEGTPVILNRLCFKDDYQINGGSKRLFKHFVEWSKIAGFDRIISWSDSSWSEGSIYTELGFKFEKEYRPDYFYWDVKNNRYVSKQSQRKKNTGCPPDITEREWCQQRGLFRIWDCGKKLWVYDLT